MHVSEVNVHALDFIVQCAHATYSALCEARSGARGGLGGYSPLSEGEKRFFGNFWHL